MLLGLIQVAFYAKFFFQLSFFGSLVLVHPCHTMLYVSYLQAIFWLGVHAFLWWMLYPLCHFWYILYVDILMWDHNFILEVCFKLLYMYDFMFLLSLSLFTVCEGSLIMVHSMMQ